MKSYKLYIFDLDDTLINTFHTVSTKIYPQLSDLLHLPIHNPEIVRENWGKPIYESLSNIFNINFDIDVINKLVELHNLFPTEVQNGVYRILNILKKHNKKIAIFSSSHPEIMNICIKNSFSDFNFDYIFNTTTEKIEKPSKGIIDKIRNACISDTGELIKSEDIVLIGDTINDYKTALSSNVDFFAVTTGVEDRTAFLNHTLDRDNIYSSIKDALVPPQSHGIVTHIINSNNEILMIKEGRRDNPFYGHWAGPHGRCQPDDILEEETVTRETLEECSIEVMPIKKLYSRSADTKVNTVSFWEAKLIDADRINLNIKNREVSDIRWVPLEKIRSGSFKLYPGTQDFFEKYYKLIQRS